MFGSGNNKQNRGAEADLNRFRVRSKLEIRRILMDLARHTELATIYFNGGKEFVLSAVVGFDPDAGRIYLDYGADEEDNRRLLAGEKRIVVSSHNRVRVQFPALELSKVEWEGHPAFAAPLPDALIRVQRREFYRVDTPIAAPLICRFATADGHTAEATIVDISLGGIGMLEPRDLPAELLAVGEVIPTCRIDLPGYGTIETGFEIRNCKSQPTGTGELSRRLGCQFTNLDGRMGNRLQRYIQKLELERRRMAKER